MLLEFTPKGIYCAAGDFYIDPVKSVEYALITHAHSDHARKGSKNYLAHTKTAGLLKLRLGTNINIQTIEYGQEIDIKGIKVTFFPSGHIIGASQIRVSNGIETWVISGDYKLEDDGISGAFEPVECTHFITESTFGMPIFSWKTQQEIFNNINDWWKTNNENGVTSVIFAYSLGKSQRILNNLDESIGKIVVHQTTKETNDVIKALGHTLPNTHDIDDLSEKDRKGSLIIAPSMKSLHGWIKNMSPYSFAQASGWMQIGRYKPAYIDKGFVISDHADWNGLLAAIKATKAQNIYTMHGYTNELSAHLSTLGYNAKAIKL